MSGGPSHIDLFDPKPVLSERDGQPIPASVIDGVHFAQINRITDRPNLKRSPFRFTRHPGCGTETSELLPHTGNVVDQMAVVRSLHTDSFNHDPAVSFMQSGDVRFGRPSMGAWLSYGLGNENRDLPSYVVLTSGKKVQPLLDNYWGSGFLPSRHQGVRFRSSGDPVLYVSNPPGIDRERRREQLDLLRFLNEKQHDIYRDPEIETRIEQFELAYRMQMSVPELTDLRAESKTVLAEYGAEPGAEGSFASNCLLARRLVERGVRFVQIFHMGWDSHGNLESEHERQCRRTDQATAALLRDLQRRGLLDETLVIWGGEFGRTPVLEGRSPTKGWGRDHHPHGFTMWMAGGGIRPGITYGETDEFGFHAVKDRVHVHDVHATALHCLGIDHEKLVYRTQGRDFRLTDVAGQVVDGILA
jgi:hypothetical protein